MTAVSWTMPGAGGRGAMVGTALPIPRPTTGSMMQPALPDVLRTGHGGHRPRPALDGLGGASKPFQTEFSTLSDGVLRSRLRPGARPVALLLGRFVRPRARQGRSRGSRTRAPGSSGRSQALRAPTGTSAATATGRRCGPWWSWPAPCRPPRSTTSPTSGGTGTMILTVDDCRAESSSPPAHSRPSQTRRRADRSGGCPAVPLLGGRLSGGNARQDERVRRNSR